MSRVGNSSAFVRRCGASAIGIGLRVGSQGQETSSRRRRQLGVSQPETRTARARAAPPRSIQGASHRPTSGGRWPTGSPVDRWTQTSGFSCTGGSGRRVRSSPARRLTRCLSRSANTVPCTVTRNLRGQPRGKGGFSGGGMRHSCVGEHVGSRYGIDLPAAKLSGIALVENSRFPWP